MRPQLRFGVILVSVVVSGCLSTDGDPSSSSDPADDPESLIDEANVAPDDVDAIAAEDLAPPSEVLAAPAAFRHPGVLVNQAQLDFVRAKVKAGAQPWKGAYDKMVASEYGSLSWTAKPRANVECGSKSNPNHGCSDERRDAVAAYTHALIWYIGRDDKHAQKSIAILEAWATTITQHTGHNAPLQTGWAGCMFPAAAEIMHRAYTGWSASGVQKVKDAFKNVYLPTVSKGNAGANGNWELIMTEATMNLAVFLDDKASFDKAVALWRRRVPAYIYLTSDGAYPKAATSVHNTKAKIIKYWQGQTTFVDGIAQETCRDFGHTEWGISAALGAAETAYQQGVDLYSEQSNRLRKGLEFHNDYNNGKAAPSWLCGGSISTAGIPTFEIGYNHFHDRMGKSLPETLQYLQQKVRPKADLTNYFIAWETLTHAGVGTTGF
jgi:Alginate lyase